MFNFNQAKALLEELGTPEFINKTFQAKTVLAAMAVEDTGKAFMDSGDYYGRNWEDNRKIHPFELPYAKTIIDGEDPSDWIITINTIKHLAARLDYCDDVNMILQNYLEANPEADKEDFWVSIGVDFVTWNSTDVSEINFTQAFEVSYASFEEDIETDFGTLPYGSYAIVTLHNGCDLRGGYTEPTLFYSEDCEELFELANNTSLVCRNDNCLFEVTTGDGSTFEMDDIEVISIDAEDKPDFIGLDNNTYELPGMTSQKIIAAHIFVDTKEGMVICPYCGSPMITIG